MVAKTQIRVAWDECDPDGMVHIVNYYRWMDQALHALMLEAGFGHRAILEKFGGYVPAVEASARYTAPLAFDDVVTIEAEITHWGRRSFRIEYRGYCGARRVFEGMEARVWATIADGEARSAPIPEAFRLALAELAGAPAM
jgi:YbgC/YbaW family acyl-CoA thioester hydrolase